MIQGELFENKGSNLTNSMTNQRIKEILASLVMRLDNPALIETGVIKWSSPIPSFGDFMCSNVATLGLNPSNREFVDESGNELDESNRRFHTLKSLELKRWSDADDNHLDLIVDSCQQYFLRNPYNRWFKKLDQVISKTMTSYYPSSTNACHLDLIPYATSRKWGELDSNQRSILLSVAGDTLGLLLRDSSIRVLILNGQSVVEQFQNIADIQLEKELMTDWTLPRRELPGIKGIGYRGLIKKLSGIELEQEILVLGFNHNIQSSFGVTNQVTNALQSWIGKHSQEFVV